MAAEAVSSYRVALEDTPLDSFPPEKRALVESIRYLAKVTIQCIRKADEGHQHWVYLAQYNDSDGKNALCAFKVSKWKEYTIEDEANTLWTIAGVRNTVRWLGIGHYKLRDGSPGRGLAFEYITAPLLHYVQPSFIPGTIKKILEIVAEIHSRGVIHADLKFENIFHGKEILIFDFNASQRSHAPFHTLVQSPCFRAPEITLDQTHAEGDRARYTKAIDLFSIGVILFELLTKTEFIPRKSHASPDALISCLIQRLGLPPQDLLARFVNSKTFFGKEAKLPKVTLAPAVTLLPTIDREGADLAMRLLNWDPTLRPSAEEALKHPFFGAG